MIGIYAITSALHDEKAVSNATKEFLGTIEANYHFMGSDFSTYGEHDLDLIYVRTGGTEGVFKSLQAQLLRQSSRPFYLLTSGKSNSLAASMEILSYLRQNGLQGEILHGDAAYINGRISTLEKVAIARQQLAGKRLGIIGKPSDWLISSKVCPEEVEKKLGIHLLEIDIQEVVDTLQHITVNPQEMATTEAMAPTEAVKGAVPGALALYEALKCVVEKYQLSGFTIRCFDLLSVVKNTCCLALARLNAEGIVAGCEGDVPALLSMTIAQAIAGVSGFQANPSRINPSTGEMLVAHCTIPLNMVAHYQLDTHFESGIGIGIRGYMPEGDVTIFKVSGDLTRMFAAEGTLVKNQGEPNLCRTQQVIQLNDPAQAAYFLTNPIGNHHIVVAGRHAQLLHHLLAN